MSKRPATRASTASGEASLEGTSIIRPKRPKTQPPKNDDVESTGILSQVAKDVAEIRGKIASMESHEVTASKTVQLIDVFRIQRDEIATQRDVIATQRDEITTKLNQAVELAGKYDSALKAKDLKNSELLEKIKKLEEEKRKLAEKIDSNNHWFDEANSKIEKQNQTLIEIYRRLGGEQEKPKISVEMILGLANKIPTVKTEEDQSIAEKILLAVNIYRVLGASPNARQLEHKHKKPLDEIPTIALQPLFRELAFKVHPDRAGGSIRAFQKLNFSWGILKNAIQRNTYNGYPDKREDWNRELRKI